jgi:chloramphenicol-sensitive protein RarD
VGLQSMSRNSPNGAWIGGAAYFIWGLFPLYWSLLSGVGSLQLLAHRGLWCALSVWLYLLIRGDVSWWRTLTPRLLKLLILGGCLVSINWGIYVAAILSGHIVDASLGYFITPLVSVVIGLSVMRERLNGLQMLAIALAAVGVTYLAWQLGKPPWVALVLACTFGVYGLVRKLAPINAIHGLAIESTVLAIPAAVYLLWREYHGTGAFGHGPLRDDVLLVLGGPVSAIPLAMFSYGAQRVSLVVLGMLQYISPIVALLLGVAVFHEPFGHAQRVAFICIWLALAVFTFNGVRGYLRSRSPAS